MLHRPRGVDMSGFPPLFRHPSTEVYYVALSLCVFVGLCLFAYMFVCMCVCMRVCVFVCVCVYASESGDKIRTNSS